jgi:hypothetical protein
MTTDEPNPIGFTVISYNGGAGYYTTIICKDKCGNLWRIIPDGKMLKIEATR